MISIPVILMLCHMHGHLVEQRPFEPPSFEDPAHHSAFLLRLASN